MKKRTSDNVYNCRKIGKRNFYFLYTISEMVYKWENMTKRGNFCDFAIYDYILLYEH